MDMQDIGQPSVAHLNEAQLTNELRRALRQTLFSSGRRISPRRMNQVGQDMAAAFLKFLVTEDEETAHTYGQYLAREGLGHRAVLSMTEALRRSCRENGNGADLPSAAGLYVNSLLEGYMTRREAYLLQEQARTQHAFLRAREQQEQ
jgi:hypothetical protein